MEEIKAIDALNYPHYCKPELFQRWFQHEEFQIMLSTTFKVLKAKPGEEWKAVGIKPSVEEMIAEMDEAGYDKVVISDVKLWSYRRHLKLIMDYSTEIVREIMEEAKGRVIGGASYNPLRIEESLRDIETAVKKYGFKYAYFHPLGFGLPPSDRKFYPLYAKCVELGIPVGFQVGHSAEPLPSDVGRPMLADEVAIDFPNLKIILSHIGWPWIDEWCSMLWRHPHVYGDTAAYFPRAYDPRTVSFMDGRGQDKVLFASNGLWLKIQKEQFMQLPVKDETKRKVLRDNAIKVFNLEG